MSKVQTQTVTDNRPNPFAELYEAGRGWILRDKPDWWNPDWNADIACRDADPDIFFPEDEEGENGEKKMGARSGSYAPARSICRSCPSSWECFVDEMNLMADLRENANSYLDFSVGVRAGTTSTRRVQAASGELSTIVSCPFCNLPVLVNKSKNGRARCVGCSTISIDDDGTVTATTSTRSERK